MTPRALPSYASALAIAAGLSACDVEDLDVGYLFVPDVSVAPFGQTEPDNVLALRVVRGSESLGFYPVPGDVPVLGTSAADYLIEPAVRRSGLASEIVVYPLYEPLATTRALTPGLTDTLRPVFRYRDGVVVGLDEGFEDANTALIVDQTPEGSAPLTQTFEGVRSGEASGVITLTADAPVYEVASVVIRPDQDRLLDLWVELDYRGDGILAVALFPEDLIPPQAGEPLSARYFQGARPRENWTKLYFDIVDNSNSTFVAEGFRVSLLAIYNEEIGEEQEIFLDNLRVVYR